jgi:hypothetical protein
MKLKILTLTIACLAAGPVWAGAGLTSAGADPTPTNNQQDEPTLAQVAPTPASSGTTAAGTSAAGTVAPGTTAQAGTATAPGGTAAGTSTGGTTAPAKTLVATPPPPPDPATLPVSVIRPLNKDATSAPAADASAAVDTAVSPQQVRVPTPSATPAKPVATPPAQSMPSGGLRASAVSPHADAAIHTPAETPADEPADTSSSGFIFYTGVGIATTILLLSFAAFFRGGGAETGKPGSM